MIAAYVRHNASLGEQVQDGWLVGTDRWRRFAAITQAFTDGERLVLRDAPAGAGRTYLVELAYRVLAHQRTGGAGRYWPERLEPGRLVPGTFTPEAGSSLEWLWLGLSGDRAAANPLHQLADQIDAHARLIRRQAAANTQWVKTWTHWALQAGGLAITGVGLGIPLGVALQALFGLAMGIDAVVEATEPLTRAGSRQCAKEFNAGWLTHPNETADLSAAVDQVVEAITLIEEHIPILIVIDDAENLDRQTVELLKALHAAPDTQVTVVVVASLAAAARSDRGDGGLDRHRPDRDPPRRQLLREFGGDPPPSRGSP